MHRAIWSLVLGSMTAWASAATLCNSNHWCTSVIYKGIHSSVELAAADVMADASCRPMFSWPVSNPNMGTYCCSWWSYAIEANSNHNIYSATATCNNERSPNIDPFGCTLESQPIQIMNDIYVKELDLDTGVYQTIHTLHKSTPTTLNEAYTNLNAADISPKDGTAYGIFKLGSTPTRYLGRFDARRIEFVAHYTGTRLLNSAAFLPNGDLILDAFGVYMKSIRPDLLTGYEDAADVPSSADIVTV